MIYLRTLLEFLHWFCFMRRKPRYSALEVKLIAVGMCRERTPE